MKRYAKKDGYCTECCEDIGSTKRSTIFSHNWEHKKEDDEARDKKAMRQLPRWAY